MTEKMMYGREPDGDRKIPLIIRACWMNITTIGAVPAKGCPPERGFRRLAFQMCLRI